jgi:hypothetical protein
VLTRTEKLGISWDASGYFAYSPEVDGFIRTLNEQNVLVPFDWTSWQGEAQRYRSDPEALAEADLLTLRRLLTTHIRADRFVEGHLASMLESGHITAILRRLREIREQMPSRGFLKGIDTTVERETDRV